MCVFAGIWDRLLINSKPNSRKNSTLQTVRIERSPCKYPSLSSLSLSLSRTLCDMKFCLINHLFVGTVSAFVVRESILASLTWKLHHEFSAQG